MYTYPHSAQRFLSEAKEAVKRIQTACDGEDLKRALVIFLESTKHSLIQLQNSYSEINGFADWWSEISNKLKADQLCKFFYTLRNEVVKAGKYPISLEFKIKGPFTISGPVQISDEGVLIKHPPGDSHKWVNKKDVPGMSITRWSFNQYPQDYKKEIDSIELCEMYIKKLEDVVDEFIDKFSTDK